VTQLDLLGGSRQFYRTFDELCAAVARQGRGLSLKAIGTADALARELAKDAPDAERVAWMARRLGLDPAEVGDGRA
jgi:hypothetical protein